MKRKFYVHKVFASFPVTLDVGPDETIDQIHERAIQEVETKQMNSIPPAVQLVVTEAAQ